MDTGRLAGLPASVHLALATIVFVPCFAGTAFDRTGSEVRIWLGGFYLHNNNRPHKHWEVALYVKHCGTGLSNGGSVLCALCEVPGICGL